MASPSDSTSDKDVAALQRRILVLEEQVKTLMRLARLNERRAALTERRVRQAARDQRDTNTSVAAIQHTLRRR